MPMKVWEVARLGPFTDHHGGACSPDVADYRAVGDTEDETHRDFQGAPIMWNGRLTARSHRFNRAANSSS